MTDAKKYGEALFELALEKNREKKCKEELELIAEAISRNPEYTALLDTPALKKSERTELIDKAFGGFDEYLVNTLKILCEAHMFHLLPSLVSGFNNAFDRHFGITRVEALTAIPLSDKQLEGLKKKLDAKLSCQVIIKNTVDKDILGGIKLRYTGVQLDASLKTRLDDIRDALSAVII